jgi:hypothetical protein
MLKANAVAYIVDDLETARAEIKKQIPPSGHREPTVIVPTPDLKKLDPVHRSTRVLIEVVSWGLWLAMTVHPERVIRAPLRHFESKQGVKTSFVENATCVLITKAEYLREVSRQMANLASVMASFLH